MMTPSNTYPINRRRKVNRNKGAISNLDYWGRVSWLETITRGSYPVRRLASVRIGYHAVAMQIRRSCLKYSLKGLSCHCLCLVPSTSVLGCFLEAIFQDRS